MTKEYDRDVKMVALLGAISEFDIGGETIVCNERGSEYVTLSTADKELDTCNIETGAYIATIIVTKVEFACWRNGLRIGSATTPHAATAICIDYYAENCC
jgi:hypothetical protein